MAKESYQLGQVTMRSGGPRGRAMEKPHDFKKAWKQILHYAKPYRIQIIAVLTLAVGAVLFSLFGPNQLKNITNMIVEGMNGASMNIRAILKISIVAVALYLLSSSMMYFQNYLTTMTATRINHDLRRDISSKINHIPLSRLDQSSFGDLLSRVTNDVDTIGESISH
ncbi:MAG: hypothetical protein IKR59_03200, partial [Lachnospiraceae bacterium]|nr:hypothetical protein [Lachnospiraceae bacterium]